MSNSGQMHFGMWEMHYSWGTEAEKTRPYTLKAYGKYQTVDEEEHEISGQYWQNDGKIILYQADTQTVFSGDVVDGYMVGVSAEFSSDKRGAWYALLQREAN